jgi:hypothetical protein
VLSFLDKKEPSFLEALVTDGMKSFLYKNTKTFWSTPLFLFYHSTHIFLKIHFENQSNRKCDLHQFLFDKWRN